MEDSVEVDVYATITDVPVEHSPYYQLVWQPEFQCNDDRWPEVWLVLPWGPFMHLPLDRGAWHIHGDWQVPFWSLGEASDQPCWHEASAHGFVSTGVSLFPFGKDFFLALWPTLFTDLTHRNTNITKTLTITVNSTWYYCQLPVSAHWQQGGARAPSMSTTCASKLLSPYLFRLIMSYALTTIKLLWSTL